MLGIDNQHGERRTPELGAGPGISDRQRRSWIQSAESKRAVCVDAADAVRARLCQSAPERQGSDETVHRESDGPEPGAGDAADRPVRRKRDCEEQRLYCGGPRRKIPDAIKVSRSVSE